MADFSDASPGESAVVFRCAPGDEYGWVTDSAWWDDIDEPVTVTRQFWKLESEDEVTFHPTTELCPRCHGEGQTKQYPEHLAGGMVALDTVPGYDPRVLADCPTCKGDGTHPYAGRMEVHDG